MKAKLPRSFDRLPPREKEIIKQVMADEVTKQIIHEEAELQKIWLQLACIVLNKNFGFGRKRLLIFLGCWREMYYINSKIGSRAEQSAYLTQEMDRIFGRGGYPREYVDKLEDL